MASRAELLEALKSGHHVRLRGRPETIRHPRHLPPEPAPTEANPDPKPLEGVVTRTPDGHLTREGMELALSDGGSVMFQGEIIDSRDDLPEAEDVEAGRGRAAMTLATDIDQKIAALEAQRARLGPQGKPAPSWHRGAGERDTHVLAAPPPPMPPADDDDDLESLTVPELRSVANARGIDLRGASKKDEIIGAIRAGRG